MSANGISTLTYKAQRQLAKLELAATKRATTGRRSNLDITELPTVYATGDNNTSHVIDNPNVGGLVEGRPWTSAPPVVVYPQATNTGFDLVNPPSSGTAWSDNGNQVTARIDGPLTRVSDHGGGMVFAGATYLEINDITNNVSPVTISMAADFESANGNWNSVYSGGNYPSDNIFSYIPGSATDVIEVGNMGSTIEASVSNTGLAWWDFVHDGTNITIYKNGVQVGSGVVGVPTIGFTQPLLVGQRYDGGGDYLTATIYRIKCVLSALDSTAITTQYNSVRSIYGLPVLSGTSITANTTGYNAGNKWLLPDIAGNPDLSPVGAGWTVSGPSGYTATVVSNANNGINWVITVDTTPVDVGNYTFTAP